MSANTIEQNQRLNPLRDDEEVWLFGYGSLIYLVDFPYLESRPASIEGWCRRFWQGSHDHRGTEAAPGRVVTLVEQAGHSCHGIAYRVDSAVFRQLDVREKNGYLRLKTDLTFADGGSAQGLVYIATDENEAWLGEADEYQIALQISSAEGASGPNDEYLVELAKSLRAMAIDDPHVFAIERCLRQIRSAG